MLVEIKLKKLKTFDSSYFIGKSHFEEDGAQNHSVFQPINRYFKVIAIKPPTSDNSLAPGMSDYSTKTKVRFTGSCLQQPKVSYTHSTIVNIYIVYELGASRSHSDDPRLKNSLAQLD